MRIEQGDGWTMYHAHAAEVLDKLPPAHCLVTDPPWGVEGGRGGQVRETGKALYRDGEWQDTPSYIETVVVPLVVQVLKRVERAAVTPGNRCLWLYPRPADMGCFWMPAGTGNGPWGFTTFSPILYYGHDWRAGRGNWPSGRQVTEAAPRNSHPCPKPLGAWTWLVDKVSRPGETVLDLFAGSGTTGVACLKLRRPFVGVEIDAAYFDLACRTLETEAAQLHLPIEL